MAAFSGPWKPASAGKTESLTDIMSNQLAMELSGTNNEFVDHIPSELINDYQVHDSLEENTEDSDLALALALQDEEDREYRRLLQERNENHGNIIVQVDNQVYREADFKEVREEGEFEDEEDEYRGNKMCANMARVYEHKQRRKGVSTTGRVSKKTYSTKEGVLDRRTRMILFKMIQNGTLNKIYGVLQTGKEGSVYCADRGVELAKKSKDFSIYDMSNTGDEVGSESESEVEDESTANNEDESDLIAETPLCPGESFLNSGALDESGVAIKIFRTTLNEFSNRFDYIIGDPRYPGKRVTQGCTRTKIKLWCEKEWRNLIRAYRHGVRVPRPLLLREHVILMSLVTDNGNPSPQLRSLLKGVDSSSREIKFNAKSLFVEIVASLYLLYQVAKLVHGDLSEYNILLSDGHAVLIDFGQAVDRMHAEASRLLRRDVENVCAFFAKLGVEQNVDQVVSFITTPLKEESVEDSSEDSVDNDADKFCSYRPEVEAQVASTLRW